MSPWNERDSVSNQNWDDVDNEFVDGTRIEKRAVEVRSPHEPDVLAFFPPQTRCEVGHVLIHELDVLRRSQTRAREHIILLAGIRSLSPAEGKLVGFSAKNDSVDRLEEIRHAIIARALG